MMAKILGRIPFLFQNFLYTPPESDPQITFQWKEYSWAQTNTAGPKQTQLGPKEHSWAQVI